MSYAGNPSGVSRGPSSVNSSMCGLAGVVAWDDRFRVDRETLARMSERIAHRGPDGEGLYLNHELQVTAGRPQVGLVHRRLAILDPDPRADQPFTDGRGRWIVFNGEIYNFRELRAELASLRPDYAWRTEGDTEVLLLAWDAWGERCVERLNGMFAFAVWDEGRQRAVPCPRPDRPEAAVSRLRRRRTCGGAGAGFAGGTGGDSLRRVRLRTGGASRVTVAAAVAGGPVERGRLPAVGIHRFPGDDLPRRCRRSRPGGRIVSATNTGRRRDTWT